LSTVGKRETKQPQNGAQAALSGLLKDKKPNLSAIKPFSMAHHGGLNMHFKLLRQHSSGEGEIPKLDNSKSSLYHEKIIYSLMKALNAIMD